MRESWLWKFHFDALFIPELVTSFDIQAGFDVVNCLTVMDNQLFIQEQLFGPGDGFLRFYLFVSWREFLSILRSEKMNTLPLLKKEIC